MSMEDYKIDDIDGLTLNCGISPSLKNIEMNQLSDEIMFICNNIIFDDFDHDAYKDETDKATFMKAHLFPSAISDVSSYNMVLKMPDFKVTVENLIEKLEFINTKKTRLEGPRMMVSSVVYIYTVIVVVLFIVYMSFKFSSDKETVAKADNYNIGFVSSAAYIYLFSKLKDHYFDYSELQGQVGHYDENICGSLANIIKTIKSIYKNLLQLPKTENCKQTISTEALELYKLVYVDDVFRQARAHFKTTVNSINSFIDKQKKYLLKVHNTNMDVKNNNEYMEDFYNILLKGHGLKLLKVNDNETPLKVREDMIARDVTVAAVAAVAKEAAKVEVAKVIKTEAIKEAAKAEAIKAEANVKNVLTNLNIFGRGSKQTVEGFQEDMQTINEDTQTTIQRSGWDKYIINNFIDHIIKMNEIVLKKSQSDVDNKNFMTHLTDILFFLKTIKNNGLPEYDQIKKLIFPVNMEEHTNFTTESFIEFVNPSLDATSTSIQATDSVLRYFQTTVLNYYRENGFINSKDTVATDNSFLAKITKRNSNVSIMKARYSEFINVMKTRILVDDDLTDEGLFGGVFEKITNDFIENTQDYKLTENIVMRYMTFMFKNDEQFDNDKSAPMILSNIRFIVGKIMKKVEQSQTIRNDLMDSQKINTAKYISFLNFESKMTELNATDVNNFFEYIKKTKETIKGFRRYTKTEEILFSKKEQISDIYSKLHRDIFIVFGIIIGVFIYEEYFKEKLAKVKVDDIKSVGNTVYQSAKKSAKYVGENARVAANYAADKSVKAARGVYNTTGRKLGEAATGLGNAATGTISGIAGLKDNVKAKGINTIASMREAAKKGMENASENLTNARTRNAAVGARNAAVGGVASTNEDVSSTDPVKQPVKEESQPVKEESQTEKDAKETEKALSFNKYINMSLIIVVYGIFMTFTKSYLMKHEADLQYDKVINVVNTTKFETEFYRLTEAFEDYKTNRTTENCKKVYNSLIQVLDMYDKCNFIKSSIKSTPFPVAEMWTNGIVLVIFLAVLYITFVQTDVESYWENQNKLDELLNSLDNIGSSDNEEELVKNIEKELSKEKDELDKAINNFDWHKSKKYIRDIYGINKEVKDEIEKVFNENTQKTGDKKISNEEKKEAYQKLIDKLEKDMDKAQDEKDEKSEKEQKGGMVTGYPMGMGMTDPSMLMPTNNKAQMQKKLLEQYTNQTNAVQSQIIKMKRDTKYVNLSMSILILMFGSYFCVTILNNTRNYQNMLVSGGTIFRDCL